MEETRAYMDKLDEGYAGRVVEVAQESEPPDLQARMRRLLERLFSERLRITPTQASFVLVPRKEQVLSTLALQES